MFIIDTVLFVLYTKLKNAFLFFKKINILQNLNTFICNSILYHSFSMLVSTFYLDMIKPMSRLKPKDLILFLHFEMRVLSGFSVSRSS